MNLSPRQIAFRLGLWVFALGYLGWKLGWFGPQPEPVVEAAPVAFVDLPGRPASGADFDPAAVVEAAQRVAATPCGAGEAAVTFTLGPTGLERVRVFATVAEPVSACLGEAVGREAWPAAPQGFEVTLSAAP